ncbi:MAG: RNA polymerase sigma factor [Pseudomonadota bacterium]
MSPDSLIDNTNGGNLAVEGQVSRAALDSAIEVYYDDIRRALLKQGGGQSQATEVVHDLYIQLCRKPEKLHGKNSVRAFLIRAALNLGIDRARRRAFEMKLFQALDDQAYAIPARIVPVYSRLDLPKRLQALQQAIFALPPQCRKVFVAYRIAGLSKYEIANDLGIKQDTVDRHLRKALLHCMEAMDTFETANS